MTGNSDSQAKGPSQIQSEDADKTWAYIHEYFPACKIVQERGLLGVGAPQEKSSKYPSQDIEEHLNQRASAGWRLVCMEPHWYYERQYISVAMSITRPLAIVGWYLTFEGLGKLRRASTTKSGVERRGTFRSTSDRAHCPRCSKEISILGVPGETISLKCGRCSSRMGLQDTY